MRKRNDIFTGRGSFSGVNGGLMGNSPEVSGYCGIDPTY